MASKCVRVEARDRNRRVQVRRLDDVQTSNDLFGVHERAVGDAVATDRGRHLPRGESVGCNHRIGVYKLVGVAIAILDVLRRRIKLMRRVMNVDQDRVLSHLFSVHVSRHIPALLRRADHAKSTRMHENLFETAVVAKAPLLRATESSSPHAYGAVMELSRTRVGRFVVCEDNLAARGSLCSVPGQENS